MDLPHGDQELALSLEEGEKRVELPENRVELPETDGENVKHGVDPSGGDFDQEDYGHDEDEDEDDDDDDYMDRDMARKMAVSLGLTQKQISELTQECPDFQIKEILAKVAEGPDNSCYEADQGQEKKAELKTKDEGDQIEQEEEKNRDQAVKVEGENKVEEVEMKEENENKESDENKVEDNGDEPEEPAEYVPELIPTWVCHQGQQLMVYKMNYESIAVPGGIIGPDNVLVEVRDENNNVIGRRPSLLRRIGKRLRSVGRRIRRAFTCCVRPQVDE